MHDRSSAYANDSASSNYAAPHRWIIAIDGPAAAGKGTAAAALAAALGFYYFNTGNLFRYVAKISRESGIIHEMYNNNHDFVAAILDFIENIPNVAEMVENSMKIPEEQLHTPEISANASIIGAIPEVRYMLKKVKRDFVDNLFKNHENSGKYSENGGELLSYLDNPPKLLHCDIDNPPISYSTCSDEANGGGCVVDGRDIGSAIFPEAQCKIFITASTAVRAQRRLDQLRAKAAAAIPPHSSSAANDTPPPPDLTYEAVVESIRARDERDGTREVAPMVITPETIVLDTSSISKEAVVRQLLGIVRIKLGLQVMPR